MRLSTLLEALKPSQYRDYVKGWDKTRYEKIFKKYTTDKKAYRIYIPFKGKPKKVKCPEELEDVLQEADMTCEDYLTGICTPIGKSDRQMKIGKVLNKIIADALKKGDESKAEHVKELLKEFIEDDARKEAAKNEYFVVISRHPYDLAGMSTGRGWTSCMNLETGGNAHYVAHDVKEGSLIAYLVKNDDKDIKHPTARVLIKPFYNAENPMDVAFGIEDRVYGTNIEGFADTVEKWVNEINDSHQLEGFYSFNKRLYDDGIKFDKVFGKAKEMMAAVNENPESVLKYAGEKVPVKVWVTALKAAGRMYEKYDVKKIVQGIKDPGVQIDLLKHSDKYGLIFSWLKNLKPANIYVILEMVSVPNPSLFYECIPTKYLFDKRVLGNGGLSLFKHIFTGYFKDLSTEDEVKIMKLYKEQYDTTTLRYYIDQFKAARNKFKIEVAGEINKNLKLSKSLREYGEDAEIPQKIVHSYHVGDYVDYYEPGSGDKFHGQVVHMDKEYVFITKNSQEYYYRIVRAE